MDQQQQTLAMIGVGAAAFIFVVMVARQTRGYTPKQEWLEARFQEFVGVARELDA